MTDSINSTDVSSHIDVLIQLGCRAVREARQASLRMGVPNVYSISGRLYHELPSGEIVPILKRPHSPTKPQASPHEE